MAPSGKLLRRRYKIVAAIPVLAALPGGCGTSKKDAALAAAILSEQRAICDEQTDGIALAWRESIGSSYLSADVAIDTFWASEENAALKSGAQIRDRQASELLARISRSKEGELRSALIDLAAQVRALCSFAADPSGFTLLTYNEKRSGLRVELDRLFGRTQLLLGQVDVLDLRKPLDEEANAAAAAALENEREKGKKAREEAAAREAAEKAAAEREAIRQAEEERFRSARRAMAQAAAEEARLATEQEHLAQKE